MISEALEFLRDRFAEAREPKTLDTGDPHTVRIYFPQSGDVRDYPRKFPKREHTFATIESFCEAVESYEADKKPTVFVTRASAICVLDDSRNGYREDRLTLTADPSSAFSRLAALTSPMKNDALARLLRTDLSGCVWDVPLIEGIEAIRWIRNESGSSVASAARNSLGLEVQAQVSGLNKPLPDSVACQFSPYPCLEPLGDVTVLCNLVIDHGKQEFLLVPRPHAVERAKIAGMGALKDALQERLDEIDIFIGSP